MPLSLFQDFFIACIGASASFIGLLFVSLSLVLESGNTKLAFSDRRLAESTFMALVNIFFISLDAILPVATFTIAYVAVIFGFFGLRSSFRLFAEREGSKRSNMAWFISSVIIYTLQITYAIRIFTDPSNPSNLYGIATVILILFGIGLLHAWGLTGIRKKGQT